MDAVKEMRATEMAKAAMDLALKAIADLPGAGPFREEGREDDWRFRARLARKEAFDVARAAIVVAFHKEGLVRYDCRDPGPEDH